MAEQKKELVNNQTGEKKQVTEQEWQQQQSQLRSQGFVPVSESQPGQGQQK